MIDYYGLRINRYICDVFKEMRTHIASSIADANARGHVQSLIEEANSMANRMEAKLEDAADILKAEEYKKILKSEIKQLIAKKAELETEIEGLTDGNTKSKNTRKSNKRGADT